MNVAWLLWSALGGCDEGDGAPGPNGPQFTPLNIYEVDVSTCFTLPSPRFYGQAAFFQLNAPREAEFIEEAGGGGSVIKKRNIQQGILFAGGVVADGPMMPYVQDDLWLLDTMRATTVRPPGSPPPAQPPPCPWSQIGDTMIWRIQGTMDFDFAAQRFYLTGGLIPTDQVPVLNTTNRGTSSLVQIIDVADPTLKPKDWEPTGFGGSIPDIERDIKLFTNALCRDPQTALVDISIFNPPYNCTIYAGCDCECTYDPCYPSAGINPYTGLHYCTDAAYFASQYPPAATMAPDPLYAYCEEDPSCYDFDPLHTLCDPNFRNCVPLDDPDDIPDDGTYYAYDFLGKGRRGMATAYDPGAGLLWMAGGYAGCVGAICDEEEKPVQILTAEQSTISNVGNEMVWSMPPAGGTPTSEGYVATVRVFGAGGAWLGARWNTMGWEDDPDAVDFFSTVGGTAMNPDGSTLEQMVFRYLHSFETEEVETCPGSPYLRPDGTEVTYVAQPDEPGALGPANIPDAASRILNIDADGVAHTFFNDSLGTRTFPALEPVSATEVLMVGGGAAGGYYGGDYHAWLIDHRKGVAEEPTLAQGPPGFNDELVGPAMAANPLKRDGFVFGGSNSRITYLVDYKESLLDLNYYWASPDNTQHPIDACNPGGDTEKRFTVETTAQVNPDGDIIQKAYTEGVLRCMDNWTTCYVTKVDVILGWDMPEDFTVLHDLKLQADVFFDGDQGQDPDYVVCYPPEDCVEPGEEPEEPLDLLYGKNSDGHHSLVIQAPIATPWAKDTEVHVSMSYRIPRADIRENSVAGDDARLDRLSALDDSAVGACASGIGPADFECLWYLRAFNFAIDGPTLVGAELADIPEQRHNVIHHLLVPNDGSWSGAPYGLWTPGANTSVVTEDGIDYLQETTTFVDQPNNLFGRFDLASPGIDHYQDIIVPSELDCGGASRERVRVYSHWSGSLKPGSDGEAYITGAGALVVDDLTAVMDRLGVLPDTRYAPRIWTGAGSADQAQAAIRVAYLNDQTVNASPELVKYGRSVEGAIEVYPVTVEGELVAGELDDPGTFVHEFTHYYFPYPAGPTLGWLSEGLVESMAADVTPQSTLGWSPYNDIVIQTLADEACRVGSLAGSEVLQNFIDYGVSLQHFTLLYNIGRATGTISDPLDFWLPWQALTGGSAPLSEADFLDVATSWSASYEVEHFPPNLACPGVPILTLRDFEWTATVNPQASQVNQANQWDAGSGTFTVDQVQDEQFGWSAFTDVPFAIGCFSKATVDVEPTNANHKLPVFHECGLTMGADFYDFRDVHLESLRLQSQAAVALDMDLDAVAPSAGGTHNPPVPTYVMLVQLPMLQFEDDIWTGISASTWCGNTPGAGCVADADSDGYPSLTDCLDSSADINPGIEYTAIGTSVADEDCNCIDSIGFADFHAECH